MLINRQWNSLFRNIHRAEKYLDNFCGKCNTDNNLLYYSLYLVSSLFQGNSSFARLGKWQKTRMSIRHWFESYCKLSGGSVGILETIQTKPWHYNNKCIDAQTRLIGKMPITFYSLSLLFDTIVFLCGWILVVLLGNKYGLKNNICTWIFILCFLIPFCNANFSRKNICQNIFYFFYTNSIHEHFAECIFMP